MDGDFEERLHKAICEAYDLNDLTQMVSFRLKQRLNQISAGGRIDVAVFDVIQWASPQPRMADLPIHAAQYKTDKKARVDALDALRAEFEAMASKVPLVRPETAATALPEELTNLLKTYEAIPRQIADGPARISLMEQTATKIRSLPLAKFKLPEALHLSDSAGERLAAVLALEQTPDSRYLRWLAERVACEPPFVGLTAAMALTNSAYVLDRSELWKVRANALAAVDWLTGNPDGGRQRTQLQRASTVAERRNATMSRSSDILFDEVVAVLIEEFRLGDLQAILKAALDITLEKVVRISNRWECIVHDLIITADTVGWDGELIKAAMTARPESNRLKSLSAKYAAVG